MIELAPLDSAVLTAGASARASCRTSTACACTCWRPASSRRTAPASCCCTASPSSPIPGARSCRRSPPPAFMSSRPTSAAMAAPPAGTPITTATCHSFRLLNAVRDALGLVSALGHRSVAAVVGHDFGSPVAAWCALVRPDVFRSVALMSAPFAGPPALPFDTADVSPADPAGRDIHAALAKLDRPRKHYQWYYSTRPANADMWHCPQGVHAFMRGYFHYKSADWQRQPAAPAAIVERRRTGQDADLLHHGPRQEYGRDRGAGHAVSRGDRGLPLAA